jgi:hypothetical protein
MAIRKGRQPSVELEALASYALFDEPQVGATTTVRAVERQRDHIQKISSGLTESLANPARLHGWRVERMFQAVIVALGSVRLIKTEDAGEFYFDDSGGSVDPPDFRVVRNDGEQVLVEVKNVAPRATRWQMRKKEYVAQLRYAELTGARLVFAHYWAVTNMWSVVDAGVLEGRGGKMTLSIERAMIANEIGLLGDALIGTEPPLTFSIIPDPSKKQFLREIGPKEAEAGFTIGGVELSSAGRRLADRAEKRIAWFLMLYGRWQGSERAELSDNGHVRRVVFESTPDEENAEEAARQGFGLVGHLSSMYSTLYNWATLEDSGEIRKLRHEPDLAVLANLIPSDYWERPNRALRLWRFNLLPQKDAGVES